MTLAIHFGASALEPGTAACLGAFDGLHLGHQALLTAARGLGDRVALVTFDPHPLSVLAPERAPRLLHTAAQRARVADSLGVDDLVLLPFDRALAELSPASFVDRFLVRGLCPRAVVVGTDFRFGAARAGDATVLSELLGTSGVAFEAVEPIALPSPHDRAVGAKLSSSDIRRALDLGKVRRAGELLGRWHGVTGTVVHGAKRGRGIGYPTANLAPSGGYVPPIGIYASAVTVWDPQSSDYGACWSSVTSVGRNPTFTHEADAPVTVETHVLGHDLGERLYGVEIEVSFVERLRGELAFDSIEPLVAQIAEDVRQAEAILDAATMARVLEPSARTPQHGSPGA